ALGVDGEGRKHPLALVEGATENAAVVQALIDNLIERGLDPKVCRLFIIDGAKALSKVIRRTFGPHTPIQRCQIHKARNVIERLPMPLHASARRALRQAWETHGRRNCAPAGDARRPCHHGNRSFPWSCPSGGRRDLRHDYAACRRVAAHPRKAFARWLRSRPSDRSARRSCPHLAKPSQGWARARAMKAW